MKRPILILPVRFRLLALMVTAALGTGPAAAETGLMEVFAQAQESDPTYREAQAQALATAEAVPQARAELLMPRLRLSGSAGRVKQDITLDGGFGAGGRVGFPTRQYALTLNQPIFNYQNYMRLKQADGRVKQAQYELDAAFQDLIIRVSERYFDVLAAQDNLDFAIAEKESLAGQLEQARQRFDVGLIAITDVQEAQAGYDRAVAAEIQARNQLDNAQEALREVSASYYDELTPIGAEVPLQRPEPDSIDTWSMTALQQNLSILAASMSAEVAHREIRTQYAARLPTIDVTGTHGFNASGGRFGSSDVNQSDITIALNMPIYEGGLIGSRVREAGHLHQTALERLEQARRAVDRQTRQSFLGVVAQISAVQALKQAVVSSETALDSTQAGFEVGTRTAVDVVAAERGLFQSRRDYARARYDYILEILRLKEAAGTLGTDDLAMAAGWLGE